HLDGLSGPLLAWETTSRISILTSGDEACLSVVGRTFNPGDHHASEVVFDGDRGVRNEHRFGADEFRERPGDGRARTGEGAGAGVRRADQVLRAARAGEGDGG